MDKSSILISGEPYSVSILGPSSQQGTFQVGYLFSINKGKSKTLGSFDVVSEAGVIAGWKSNSSNLTDGESLKRLFLQLLPSINVPVNLDSASTDTVYFKILFTFGKTRFDEEKNIFYINPENSPEDLVEKLVYKDEIADKQVQINILRYLQNFSREKPSTTCTVPALKSVFFLDDKTFEFNLNHLWDTKKITISGVNSGGVDNRQVRIRSSAVDYLDNMEAPAAVSMQHFGDYVGGDKIYASSSGNNSPNVIKSKNVRIDISLFDKLRDEIEKEYDQDDKKEILAKVDEARELAKKDTPENRTKILKLMGFVMSRASEFAQVASLALQIYQFMHVNP